MSFTNVNSRIEPIDKPIVRFRLIIRECSKSPQTVKYQQSFRLTWRKDVRMGSSDMCLDVSEGGNRAKVAPFSCHGAGGNQYWKYDPAALTLKHGGNPRCLDADVDAGELFVTACQPGKSSQQWRWQRTDDKRLENWDADPWP